MKIFFLLFFLIVACLGISPSPAQVLHEVPTTLGSAMYSSVAWGDFDRDEDLDLLIAGDSGSRVYRNNGPNAPGIFQDIGANLMGLDRGSAEWGDYDSDGDIDLLLTGGEGATPYTRVYENNGNGGFIDINAGLYGYFQGSATWGDYDNDGDLDIFLSGAPNQSDGRIFRNDGDRKFSPIGSFVGLDRSTVSLADYDNDGDLDLLTVGNSFPSFPFVAAAQLYQNSGAGYFNRVTTSIAGAYDGDTDWGDYDNDGDLDLVVVGDAESKIYRNDGNSIFTPLKAALLAVAFGCVAWGDYDNDGDLDLVLSGWTGSDNLTKLYRNQGQDAFQEANENLVGVYAGAVAWGDYDNDSDLDLLLVGPATRLYRNDHNVTNAQPSAPSNLRHAVNSRSVTLSWDAASDAETPSTGLSYNVRIGIAPGESGVFSAAADPVSGKRYMAAIGNAQQQTSWTIRNLPGGDYYWTVQAIDAGFTASAFAAEQTFSIPPDAPTLVAPSNGAAEVSTSPTFIWAVTDCTGLVYRLQVSTSAQFTTTVFDQEQIPSTSMTVQSLQNNTTYFWRVQASNAVGASEWSSVWRFTTLVSPPFSEVSADFADVSNGDAAWGDYDNDDDLDLLLTGYEGRTQKRVTQLYRNEGNAVFTPITTNMVGVEESAVDWGDYDNDGDLDVVLIGATGTRPTYTPVSKVYRNDGNGTFTDIGAPLYEVGDGDVTWVDYDNDGDLDVFLCGAKSLNPSQTGITWIFRNEGYDQFRQANIFFAGLLKSSADWGDFDEDGDLDLLMTGGYGGLTSVLRNDSEDNFRPIKTTFPGIYFGSARWGDYDNDGDLDILVSGATDNGLAFRLYRNEGNEIFTSVSTPWTGIQRGSSHWGDYDNDGDPDLLITGHDGRQSLTKIFRNDRNDSFIDIGGGLLGIYDGVASWTDYDNDGDLDIFVSGYNDSAPYHYTKLYRNDNTVKNTAPRVPADLVGRTDGSRVDLRWATPTDNETPSASLSYNLYVGTNPASQNAFPAHSNLANGYHRLVSVGNAQYSGKWFLNNLPNGRYFWSVQAIDGGYKPSVWASEGTFLIGPDTSVGIIDLQANLPGIANGAVDFGDYDNDDDLDFVITGRANGGGRLAKIFRNDGANVFTDIQANLTGVEYSSVDWGDFDNDGDLDLLITGDIQGGPYGVASCTIYRNDGDGRFADTQIPLPGIYLGGAEWGDFDNDGDLDIALTGVGAQSASITTILRNDRNGRFVDIQPGLQPVNNSLLSWADFDRDGDLDLFVSGAGWPSARMYRNDGNGRFASVSTNFPRIMHGAIAWGDYDHDGDLDALLTGGDYGTVPVTDYSELYRNDGGGRFTFVEANLAKLHESSAAWGDYDNDGDLDILISGSTGSSSGGYITRIYRNDNDGAFVDIHADLLGFHEPALAWADFDNDGDLDILCGGWTTNSVGVTKLYRNYHEAPNTLPSVPQNLLSTVTGDSVTLTWSSAQDAETPPAGLSYNLRVGATPGGSEIMPAHSDPFNGYRQITKIGNTHHLKNWTLYGLEGGKYYWTVQAIDHGFAGSIFATVRNFTIQPRTPKLFSPHDSASGADTTVVLQWFASRGTSSYHLQLSLNESFSNVLFNLPNLTDTSAVVSRLEHNTIYFWRVNAKNSAGTSAWSPAWQFTTTLARPRLNSPLDHSTGIEVNPTLSWHSVSGAQFYQLQVSADSLFTIVDIDTSDIPDTLYTIHGLADSTRYYWRVKAISITNSSGWSETWQFITGITTAVTFYEEPPPVRFQLDQNYPNPFNPTTIIRFVLVKACHVKLTVFNSVGQEVALLLDENKAAGEHDVHWNAADVPAGVYVYRLQADEFVESKKFLLLK